jgi:hypothetical protein
MIDSDRSLFGDLGHTLVIGSCRTGKTHILRLRWEGVAFEWKLTPGAHHHWVWAPVGEGMSSADARSGGQER